MKGFILSINEHAQKKDYKKDYTLNFKTLYSPAKLVIPKENGKPTLKSAWYVYYRFRNPTTDKLEKFEFKQGINRLKTISERKKAGEKLKNTINRLLQESYNPFEEKKQEHKKSKTLEKEKIKITTLQAFELAHKEKIKTWSENSLNVNFSMLSVFKKWLKSKKLDVLNIEDLEKKHIALFLNELTDSDKRSVGNTTRNNYKRLISSLFSQLIADDILKHNFVVNIPLLKQNAEKNAAFTKEQLFEIKKWCLKNDPYLYEFIRFIMYALLRPVEVCRIKLIDIDLNNNILKVRTKTERNATILIIEPLQKYLSYLNIKQYPNTYNLFSKNKKPAIWETQREKSKVDFFTRKFQKLKKEIGESLKLTDNHTVYSARHSAVLDLYGSFKTQGLTDLEAKHKLMTITRHKSLSGLENYLRGIGASLPENYSDDYTVDF